MRHLELFGFFDIGFAELGGFEEFVDSRFKFGGRLVCEGMRKD